MVDDLVGFSKKRLRIVVPIKQLGMGMIISSHDPYVAQAMQVVYQLHDGKLDIKS